VLPGDKVLRYDANAHRFADATGKVAGGDLPIRLNWSRPEMNECPAERPSP